MEAWAATLLERRSGVWGGLGLLLCVHGSKLRYTSVFFPLLRISDARHADIISEHFANVLLDVKSRPSPLHPAIWSTVQALMLESAMIVINPASMLEVLLGGFVACSALWIVDAPSNLVAVGGLYPRLRAWRIAASSAMRRAAGCAVVEPLHLAGASPQFRQVSRVVAERVAFILGARLFVTYDFVCSVAVNGLLGVELLQRAGRECFPLLRSPSIAWTFDLTCVSLGTWCAARQVRFAARSSQPGPVSKRLGKQWPFDSKELVDAWRVITEHLDALLLL